MNFKKQELKLDDICGPDSESIIMKMAEETDQFIFEQIEPYCANIVKGHISKDFVKQALINYKGINITNDHRCPLCQELLHIPLQKIKGRKEVFCWNCGMKLNRRW